MKRIIVFVMFVIVVGILVMCKGPTPTPTPTPWATFSVPSPAPTLLPSVEPPTDVPTSDPAEDIRCFEEQMNYYKFGGASTSPSGTWTLFVGGDTELHNTSLFLMEVATCNVISIARTWTESEIHPTFNNIQDSAWSPDENKVALEVAYVLKGTSEKDQVICVLWIENADYRCQTPDPRFYDLQFHPAWDGIDRIYYTVRKPATNRLFNENYFWGYQFEIYRWFVSEGRLQQVTVFYRDYFNPVKYGNFIAAIEGGDELVYLDTRDPRKIRLVDEDILAAVVSPDGSKLLTLSSSGIVRERDEQAQSVSNKFSVDSGSPTDLVVDGSGQMLMLTNNYGLDDGFWLCRENHCELIHGEDKWVPQTFITRGMTTMMLVQSNTDHHLRIFTLNDR